MTILKKALEIATKAHEGQFRKDGITPYITHPVAVRDIALNWVKDFKEIKEDSDVGLYRIIYWAFVEAQALGITKKLFIEIIRITSENHDGPEDASDKGFTIDYIISELQKVEQDYPITFFILIQRALDSVTKREGESYLDFIIRAKSNRIGRIIKMADIQHNLSTLDPKKDKHKIDKYSLAKHILLN